MAESRAGVREPAGRALDHRSPRQTDRVLWSVPVGDAGDVGLASAEARRAGADWAQADCAERASLLLRLADRLEARADAWGLDLAEEIGKPITQGRGEALRSAAMLRAIAARAREPVEYPISTTTLVRYRPVGVIGLVTPWNNPLYIPLGKIAPALLYGNTVVWKPAPAGTAAALRVMGAFQAVDCPPGVVNLACGDETTAWFVMADPNVDAVALTGSATAGARAVAVCGRRGIALQAELGGNNASIVWSDADLAHAAYLIADGAFGMAGQRCTANRRAVVDRRCRDAFLSLLIEEVARLAWGDPAEPETVVGPLVSVEHRDRVSALVGRAASRGMQVLVPRGPGHPARDGLASGAYYPPTIVFCDDPGAEIVQEETFGPVLIIQVAADWEEAIALCNGVKQGLVASLFSASPVLQERFLLEAEAGILKLNRTTADAEIDVPFGGWKASGLGPPEHGASDREFYTRTQTVYR